MMMVAELVLPMPGGPDSSTAFLLMSLGLPLPQPPPLALGAAGSSPLMFTRSLRIQKSESELAVYVLSQSLRPTKQSSKPGV